MHEVVPPPLALTRTNWSIVLISTFAGATAALQIGKAAATLPLIRSEFGVDVVQLAIYVSLISIVAATAGLGFGILTRKWGPRRMAAIGLVLITLGSGIGAIAPSLQLLLASRVIEAFGFALCTTALPVIIQRTSASHEKALTLGVWATWMPLGIALSMVIGFFMIEPFGWRQIFWVCSALPALAAFFLLFIAPVDSNGIVNHPLGDLRQINNKEVWLTAANFTAFSAANLIVMTFLPTLLVDDFSIAPKVATIYSFCAALCLLPTNLLTGKLLDAGISPRPLFLVSFTIMGLAALLLFAPFVAVWLRLSGIFIFSLATGVPPAIIWASIPRFSKSVTSGPLLSGIFYQCAGIGQVVGPLLAGFSVNYFHGWFVAAWVVAMLTLLGLVQSYLLKGTD